VQQNGESGPIRDQNFEVTGHKATTEDENETAPIEGRLLLWRDLKEARGGTMEQLGLAIDTKEA